MYVYSAYFNIGKCKDYLNFKFYTLNPFVINNKYNLNGEDHELNF